MKKKTVSGITLTLLLIGTLTLAFNIQLVKAFGTVYIRADGSVDPSTAPIQRVGDIYTFTDNIYDSIVVERDNIVVDGAGYTAQGAGAGYGIYLGYRNNVTVKDVEVTNFNRGIYLYYSSNNTLIGNTATNNGGGIWIYASSNNIVTCNSASSCNTGIALLYSSNNNILSGNNSSSNNSVGIILYTSCNNNVLSGNTASSNPDTGLDLYFSTGNVLSGNIASNNDYGIYLYYSSNNVLSGNAAFSNYLSGIDIDFGSTGNVLSGNTVSSTPIYGILLCSTGNVLSGNTAKNNKYGIYLPGISANVLSGNIVSNNDCGIRLYRSSSNTFFHNDLINNGVQAHVTSGYVNTWDNGYPSGGNYWSDHTGVDEFSGSNQDMPGADGIIDTPYTIATGNQDNYPLMKPYGGAHDVGITGITPSETSVEPGSMLDINITVLNYGLHTETFNLTAYANTIVISQTEVTLSSRNSATITFTWDTTGIIPGNYIISAYATPVPNEIDTADNYFEDGAVTIVTPEYLTQKLIETVETWNLPEGTENSLTSKLEEAILLLDKGNNNGAIHKLLDFINQVEALREEKLTNEQADYLIEEAQRIIDLI